MKIGANWKNFGNPLEILSKTRGSSKNPEDSTNSTPHVCCHGTSKKQMIDTFIIGAELTNKTSHPFSSFHVIFCGNCIVPD
jgi:hypothetical protein